MTGFPALTPRSRLIWDGQSHCLWPPTVVHDGRGPTPRRLGQLVHMLNGTVYPSITPAVGNTSWTVLATTAETRLRPYARPDDGLFLWGGQADIYTEGNSGAQTYADACAYADTARGWGFAVIVALTSPMLGGVQAGHETAVDEYNAALMADGGAHFDRVIDMHTAPFDAPTDTTFFEVDGVHLTDRGAQVAAQRIYDAHLFS